MERELLIRFLKCETTPQEEALLADWLEADPAHRKELDAMQLILEGMALAAPELEKMTASQPARGAFLFTKLARISIAASIALIIAAGWGYRHYSRQLENLSGQRTIVEVPAGQRICLTLGDGTKVWLNAGAQLEYPSVFSGEKRRVKISGEAMFQVEHDARHPFVVETFACNVEVLGTKFNVEANEATHEFSTALIKGSIKLTNRLNNAPPIVMKVNEVAHLVHGNLQLNKIKNHDDYLWPDGIISIHDVGFEELMTKFERIFNVQIEIQRKEIPHIDYNRGKIRVSDGIDHALQVLQMTSEFTYKRDTETGVITIL